MIDMATPVTMPQLGETVVEGTITKWLKQEGESVDRDEPLFEISTDKVDTEVPSPVAGKILQIKVPEGETVQVGTELALIETDGQGAVAPSKEEAAPASAPQAETEPEEAERAEEAAEQEERQEPKPAEEEPRTPPAEDERGKGPAKEGREEVRAPSAPAGSAAPAAQARQRPPAAEAEPPSGEDSRRNILSPLVRRLAEEHQVDLSRVQGTGTGGRITKKDIQGYIESGGERPAPVPEPMPRPEPPPAPMPEPQPVPQPEPLPRPVPPPAPQPQVAAREEAVPLTRMRQAIARNMVASMQTTACAWNLVEVNMENISRTLHSAKESFRQREGISLTYMHFVDRAVCEALLAFPDVTSKLRQDQLVRKQFVNL